MQWHQLDHMQTICTSLQTDDHTNTSSLNFYRLDALLDAQPTVSKHWRQNYMTTVSNSLHTHFERYAAHIIFTQTRHLNSHVSLIMAMSRNFHSQKTTLPPHFVWHSQEPPYILMIICIFPILHNGLGDIPQTAPMGSGPPFKTWYLEPIKPISQIAYRSLHLFPQNYQWLSVLWRCWFGGRKGIWPVKIWVVGCWCGYLSGAYGPGDATATHHLFASVKSGLVLPFWYRLTRVVPDKWPLNDVCVCNRQTYRQTTLPLWQ